MKYRKYQGLDVCSICGSSNFKGIANLEVSILEKCCICGVIENRIISAVTESDYYESIYQPLYEEYYKKFRKSQYRTILPRLEQLLFKRKRVLDIGCSYGWFLEICKEWGWESFGAEPSKKVFEYLSEKNQKNIYNIGIENLNKIDGNFNLITLWNVFEHLPSPVDAINSIKEKLDANGTLLICVPNLNGLITRLSFLVYWITFGKLKSHLFSLYQLDNGYPHLFHYNKHTLEVLLKRNGFEIYDSWEQDIVDLKNLGIRIKSYSNGNIAFEFIMNLVLNIMQRLARITWNDELVVLARKSPNEEELNRIS